MPPFEDIQLWIHTSIREKPAGNPTIVNSELMADVNRANFSQCHHTEREQSLFKLYNVFEAIFHRKAK